MAKLPVPIIRGDKVEGADYVDFLPKNLLAIPKDIRGAAGYMLAHDGLKLINNELGKTYDRGAIYNERQKKHLRVIGDRLYSVNVDGSTTNIGEILGNEQASFAYSFNSTLIVTNKKAWLYKNDGTLSRIIDLDLGAPIDGCWIAGYYVFTDGEYLYHTDINDETQVSPLQFATAEISPDSTLGVMATQEGLLIAFGSNTMQWFVNQANEFFAFSNIPQKAINAGIVGTYAKTMLSGGVFIVGGRAGESPSVYGVGAGDIQSISTRTVDTILASYNTDELATTVLESRVDERYELLIVRLPRHTLVFNYSAAKVLGANECWSVLSTGVDGGVWIGANGVYDPARRQWVYGSAVDGRIFSLDKESAAQDGQLVEFEVQTPLIPLEEVRVSKIELDTVTGFGTADMAAFISVSTDGVFQGAEWIELYSTPSVFGGSLITRRIGYVDRMFSTRVRVLSKQRVNFSKLVITYG